jgi:inorganic pyrophosphatase
MPTGINNHPRFLDELKEYLGNTVTATIDRPLGSKHPEWDIFYPINYGYVPGHLAPDGEELDVYVLGVFEPVNSFSGTCIAIVHRIDDDDDKLVLVPEGVSYRDEQIQALVEFQERFYKSVIIRS